MIDAVRQAELRESIKEHVTLDYKREEPTVVPDSEIESVASYLNVDKPDVRTKEKLAFIKGQFRSETKADFLYQLRNMEQRLTPPRIGENRLDILYNYLRAKASIQDAERLRDTYLAS